MFMRTQRSEWHATRLIRRTNGYRLNGRKKQMKNSKSLNRDVKTLAVYGINGVVFTMERREWWEHTEMHGEISKHRLQRY